MPQLRPVRTSLTAPAPPAGNEYLAFFEDQTAKFPADLVRVLDPALDAARRKELFGLSIDPHAEQALQYAWAIPDARALRVRRRCPPPPQREGAHV